MQCTLWRIYQNIIRTFLSRKPTYQYDYCLLLLFLQTTCSALAEELTISLWIVMNINNSSQIIQAPKVNHLQGTMWSVAFGLESLLIVIANLLSVAVFLTGKQLRKRSTYCLINLSMADLMVGAVPMPMFVYLVGAYHSLWDYTWGFTSWTNVYLPTDMICAFASIFCLVLLSLERIYATLAPFRHRQIAGGGYILAIAAVWFCACIVALSSFFSLSIFHSKALSTYIPMTALTISVLVMCGAYFLIWIKVKCHKHDEGCYSGRKSEYERKLAKTLFIVTAASLTAWLPFVIVSTAASFYDFSFDFTVVLAVKLLHYTNSLINPIIYTFRIREFRRALNGLLRARNSSHATPSAHIPLEVIRGGEKVHIRFASLRS